MAIRDIVSRLFSRQTNNPNDPSKINGPLPFVKLFGYEKAYGTPQPENYALQVQQFKSWVYACAQKNAFSVAKAKIRLYKEKVKAGEDSELEEVKQHPFLDVLSQVNPFSNRFELMSITQINLELTGNAYWWMPRNALRVPNMIWNIPSHWMKVVPSVDKFIEGYVMQVPGMGKYVPFDEEEIVHFKFPSPFNLYYGVSPTYAAMYGIDLNTQIKTYGINYFMNNAQPSGVLYTDTSLHPDQYKRLKDGWNAKYKGAENAGKIAILESGLKYQQTGSTLRDARWDNITPEVRDEILAMFGVPAAKLGIVTDVNRANAEALDYTYANETILPRLTLIEEKINEKILPVYDVGLTAKFENIVPEDKQFKLQERQINISSGFSSIDEEREKEGLEPYDLPETKVPLIPFGLNPAGSPKPDVNAFGQPTDGNDDNQGKSVVQKILRRKTKDAKWQNFVIATAPQEKLFAVVMQRFFEGQQGEVMRNFNKFKSAKNFDTKDIYSNIIFNMNEQNLKLKILTAANIRNAYLTGLALGVQDTGQGINFDLFEPNIARAVEGRGAYFASKVNESTGRLVEEALKEGLEKGESMNDIAKRLDQIFEFRKNFGSKASAQTEVIGATNDGQLRAYAEAGIEKKEWLSARDEKVRESHQIDGQIVKLTDSFVTGLGSHLHYPGDRSSGAPAEDIINCRCTVIPAKEI